MTDEATINTIGRTLEFYKVTNKKVHINLIGKYYGLWRNGYILFVDNDKREFLIVDDKLGNLTYSFYEIDPRIKPYDEGGKK